jgi:hypothetical protein
VHSSSALSTSIPDPGVSEPDTAGQLVVDTRHQYIASSRGDVSECRVRVYANGEAVIVVLIEQPDKELSHRLLEVVEQLASEILPDVVNTPDRRDAITWIANTRLNPSSPGRFIRIAFERFRPELASGKERLGVFQGSSFQHIDGWDLQQLIGMEWE